MGDNIKMFLKERHDDSVNTFRLASLGTRSGILWTRKWIFNSKKYGQIL